MDMKMEEAEEEKSWKCDAGFNRELENYRSRCSELEERTKKAEERCAALELEVAKKKGEFELLEFKFKALEAEKFALEKEFKISNWRGEELEKLITQNVGGSKVGKEGEGEWIRERIVDLTEETSERDKVVQLMFKSSNLECEKKTVECAVVVQKDMLCSENQNLRLNGGKHPLGGKIDYFGQDTQVASKSEDGLDGVACLDSVQTQKLMVERAQSVLASVGMESPCYSIEKEIECHQETADTPICMLHQYSTCDKEQKRAATPICMLHQYSTCDKEQKRGILLKAQPQYGCGVRKQLVFEEEKTPRRRMAPSTPAGAKPASVGIIDISDSDDEPDNVLNHIHAPTPELDGSKMINSSEDCALGHKNVLSGNSFKLPTLDESDEEDMSYKGSLLFISTPKRKRASNVVTSDSDRDSDNDDDVPICIFKRKNINKLVHDSASSLLNSCSVTSLVSGDGDAESLTPPKRRLVTLRQCEEKGRPSQNSSSGLKAHESKNYEGVSRTEDAEDEKMEDTVSDSEGESLGGFIVDKSDAFDDGDDTYSESKDESDGNLNFDEILSQIRRNGIHKSVWEFEADMLAAFGKDPELCMSAVCALYRQQTSEEKYSKETLLQNRRGFSKFDALRGTTLAEFLTDGDPQGGLKRSVEELQDYNPKALELCKTLATHYSKQLFEIYKNKEDPLFLP